MLREMMDPADAVTRGQLKFLLNLAGTEKLSRTAAELGLSLATASRNLDKLREAFGDPLFTPHARGLTPTDTMTRLVPEIRRALEATDALFDRPTFSPAKLERTFRFASGGLVVPSLLAYVIPRIAREAPGVHLLLTHRTARVFEDIESGAIDLAMTNDVEVPPALRSVNLFELEIGVLLRADHPLVAEFGGGAPTLEAFMRYQRLAMSVSASLRTASWDRQFFGDSPEILSRVICASSTPLELAAVLEETDYLMLVPHKGAESLMKHYRLVWIPLPAEAQAEQHEPAHAVLVWREALHRDPGHQWLRGLIREWARLDAGGEPAVKADSAETAVRSLV